MGVAAGFLVVVGLPFLVATGLGVLPMPRLARIVLIVALPIALMWSLYGTNHSLDEIGLGPIAFLVVAGWLLGFWAARIIRRRHFANLS